MKLGKMTHLLMVFGLMCLDGSENQHCQQWMLAPQLLVRVSVHVKNLWQLL